jgi:hypothetical protein
MRSLNRYLSWEVIAIHALTGVLFAIINALIIRVLLPQHWLAALALVPVAAFSWWGFFAEARFVIRTSRDLRSR